MICVTCRHGHPEWCLRDFRQVHTPRVEDLKSGKVINTKILVPKGVDKETKWTIFLEKRNERAPTWCDNQHKEAINV